MFYTPDHDRGWTVLPAYDGAALTATLATIMDHPAAAGFSDVGIRNLLYSEVLNVRPRKVLEIGTHLGTGAVVMGTALKRNGYGTLLSLEPQEPVRLIAQDHLRQAQVDDVVEILPGFSYDEACRARLEAEAPFDMVFIDGAHEYEAVLFDIRLCYELLRENGLIVLHDSGRASPDMDQSGRGGVRRAVHDFARDTSGAVALFREHPLWLNPCGAALICKQRLEPPVLTD